MLRFIQIAVVVGSLCIIIDAVVKGPLTPIQLQNLDVERHGAFTLALATDGCYWRTYMRPGSHQILNRIDIIPDGDKGKENCPYRK